ncbi:MAG: uroporphyrinogen-III synthase [Pseudomonadota bacterium]
MAAANTNTRVILTRPKAQAMAFADMLLGATDHEVFICPLMEIVTQEYNVPDGADVLIFTSANAVRPRQSGEPTCAICVGDATADAAVTAGYEAVSVNGTAQDLSRYILSQNDLCSAALFHPHGAHVTGGLHEALRDARVNLTTQTVYHQQPRDWNDSDKQLIQDADCIFPIFSPNSGGLLAAALLDMSSSRARFVAISSAAAAPIPPHLGDLVKIAPEPTRVAMLEAVLSLLN